MTVVNVALENGVAEIDAQKLEVFYTGDLDDLPPVEYTKNLLTGIYHDDDKLLMETLDTQDVNPWEILFTEDGLGAESPSKFNLLGLAGRKKAWKCLAELTEHFADCGMVGVIMAEVGSVFPEYEALDGDEPRGRQLEMWMQAFNKGFAAHLVKHGDMSNMFHPICSLGFPKAARFAMNDFSKYNFKKKAGKNQILEKRLMLRQKVLLAIASNNLPQLANALDAMKANAMAYQNAKREAHDSLTTNELTGFICIAILCEQPPCIVGMLSKVVEFQKALAAESIVGKLDPDEMKELQELSALKLIKEITMVILITDSFLNKQGEKAAVIIEEAIKKELCQALRRETKVDLIEELKDATLDKLQTLKPCVSNAFDMLIANIGKNDLLKHVGKKSGSDKNAEPNNPVVELPRQRMRL